MKLDAGKLRLSATDVANFLGCRQLTALDRAVAEGRLARSTGVGIAGLDALVERGLEHEQNYLTHLRAQGLTIDEAPDLETAELLRWTLERMRAGVDGIAQGALASKDGRWFGKPDVLLRRDTPSSLGPFSYEPYDTKLARETRVSAVLQLCVYAELLESAQGLLPERVHVVPPHRGFSADSLRTGDVMAYYRWVRTGLLEVLEASLDHDRVPEPTERCDTCHWFQRCDGQRRAADHLSFVAGATRSQRRELGDRDVVRLAELAVLPVPITWKPRRGSKEALMRVRHQASIQLRGRVDRQPRYELLPVVSGRGLTLLPEPSPGDIFFDMEGDPFVGLEGLEYLLGWAVQDERGQWQYRKIWALDYVQERSAFEAFLTEALRLRDRHPGMHIYHFAPYEPSTLKRLMGRHGCGGEALDQLLRGGRFVDLLAVVRHGLRASVESYSIKKLEAFYRFNRAEPLEDAGTARRVVERAIERRAGGQIPTSVLEQVERYNSDDCLSARDLRDWLESLRQEHAQKGNTLERPLERSGEASEQRQEVSAKVALLQDALLRDVSAEPTERAPIQQSRWLLAQLLEFHQREKRPVWWEFHRLRALPPEELFDEPAALAGLEFVETAGGTKKCPIHRYRFPPQEVDLREGFEIYSAGCTGPDEKLGTVENVDIGHCTVDVKKNQKAAGIHPEAIFGHKDVAPGALETALHRFAEVAIQDGLAEEGRHQPGRDLLRRVPPRMRHGAVLPNGTEDAASEAPRVVCDLAGGVLPIQGPPGSGKTHTAAEIILALLRDGKKVGVTAMSHRVIENVLLKVQEVARERGVSVRMGQKPGEGEETKPGVALLRTNDEAHAALDDGSVQVLGATTYLWAREQFEDSVDVLIVDEAGQLSLAHALAASLAAKNVVLVGDPQQLKQPIKGVHPEGVGVSALEHILDGHPTVPEDRGLFLAHTWRLAPAIAKFTSETFYEGRLQARAECEQQRLDGTNGFDGAGLWFVPVEHEGNTSRSLEEVEAVRGVLEALRLGEARWTNREGAVNPLTSTDVLVLAPYNAQVSALSERFPELEVGTVDKFQGQEGAVVILSMTTSSAEEAPRGMEFLYSLNRLNVATSRGRCACILVASPRVLEPECKSVRQMVLANAVCRFRERCPGGGEHLVSSSRTLSAVGGKT